MQSKVKTILQEELWVGIFLRRKDTEYNESKMSVRCLSIHLSYIDISFEVLV